MININLNNILLEAGNVSSLNLSLKEPGQGRDGGKKERLHILQAVVEILKRKQNKLEGQGISVEKPLKLVFVMAKSLWFNKNKENQTSQLASSFYHSN